MSSITPTLSCKPKVCMFIIQVYYTKSKRLQSLDSLLKDVETFVRYLIRHEMLQMKLCNTLSCKPKFYMFIIQVYYTKSKRLQSLESLLEDVEIFVRYLIRHEMLQMKLCNTLSCKPRFYMFIIQVYYTKSKRLQSLESLLKDVETLLYVI